MNISARLMVAHLARENAENCPHLASIQTPVYTPSAGGRRTLTSWTPVVAAAPCRLSLASDSDREQLDAGQLAGKRVYVVVFESDIVGLTLEQRVVVSGTTNGVAFSHTLQIEKIWPPDRAGEFLRKVIATMPEPTA